MSLSEPGDMVAMDHLSAKRAKRSFAMLRSVGALVLREMSTAYGRKPGGYIWAIIQPLATIMVMALAFSVLQRSPALGTSFILFKATGILVFQMFRNVSRMVAASLTYSGSLLIYPGVTWLDAIIARFVLNGLVIVIVSFLILGGDIVIEGLTLILYWPAILLSASLALFLGFGFGVLNCYLSERIEIYSNIWNIATAPLMIVSGVLVLFDELPESVQEVLWYNPLVHVVGLSRMGFYSIYRPDYVSVGYVVVCALVPLVLGLILLRRNHSDLLNR